MLNDELLYMDLGGLRGHKASETDNVYGHRYQPPTHIIDHPVHGPVKRGTGWTLSFDVKGPMLRHDKVSLIQSPLYSPPGLESPSGRGSFITGKEMLFGRRSNAQSLCSFDFQIMLFLLVCPVLTNH